ncbi:unnamed protein product [Rhizopus stolonifer]
MKAVFLLSLLLFYSNTFALQEYCNPGYKPTTDKSFELDLSKLNQDFTLYQNISTPPSIKSTITQINIVMLFPFQNLTECNKGTYVCQKIVYSQNNTDFVAEVHNIVGNSKKSKLKTELKAIEPKEDSSKSGYRYSLALSRGGSDQSTMITLVCDTSQSRKDKPSEPSIVSYDNHVLSLEWKTVFACSVEKKTEKKPDNNHQNKSPKEEEEKEEKEEGTSAISLFFIIILVLLGVYFVGGAIYNIKVYNAKGFDLIIHRGTYLWDGK